MAILKVTKIKVVGSKIPKNICCFEVEGWKGTRTARELIYDMRVHTFLVKDKELVPNFQNGCRDYVHTIGQDGENDDLMKLEIIECNNSNKK